MGDLSAGRTLALAVDGTAIELDLAALAAGEPAVDPARLSSALAGGSWELARALSASFDDGMLVAVIALRPAGAGGHGEEAVTGILARAGEPAVLDETLISVEYDPEGAPRRIGLELYEGPDSLPMRIAGDRAGDSSTADETEFALRHGQSSGSGRLTVVRPG
jgi:hypothetical protein